MRNRRRLIISPLPPGVLLGEFLKQPSDARVSSIGVSPQPRTQRLVTSDRVGGAIGGGLELLASHLRQPMNLGHLHCCRRRDRTRFVYKLSSLVKTVLVDCLPHLRTEFLPLLQERLRSLDTR